ncbi:Glycosyl transferase family 1 protein-like, variant 2 [Balamuthia mandrillaris]
MRKRQAPRGSDKDERGAASAAAAAAASLPKQHAVTDPTASVRSGGVGFIKVTLVLVLCPALLLLCLFLLSPTDLHLFPSSSQEHLPSSRPSAPPPASSSPEAAGSSSPAPLLSPDLFVWWMAPIFSGGGYCSEALSYLVPLHSKVARLRVSQHGDAFHRDFVFGLPAELRSLLTRLYATPLPSLDDPAARMVVVCHSEAGAWYPPRYETSFCPPPVPPEAKANMYRVGRTMFETDRIPDGWAERCNDMDEIWVPTEFHRRTFAANGVKPEKLHVLPQSVNSTFFDPAKAERDDGKLDELLLPAASFGAAWKDVDRSAFRFFSSFKWERRKTFSSKILRFGATSGNGAIGSAADCSCHNSFPLVPGMGRSVESLLRRVL